jgi:hypothetical protein
LCRNCGDFGDSSGFAMGDRSKIDNKKSNERISLKKSGIAFGFFFNECVEKNQWELTLS